MTYQLLPGGSGGQGILAEIMKRFRLTWLLFTDNRISWWMKAVLPLTWLYFIMPLDFLPDIIPGAGQLDDIGVVLLGMALFVKLCPIEIVQAYMNELDYGHSHDNDNVIEAAYQVIDKE